MSNVIDILIACTFATAVSVLVRSLTGSRKLPEWWWGLAILPLLSIGVALAIMLFPRPIPEGWQEGDIDTGFSDFIALVFFGAVVPTAYLALSLPITLAVRLWKSRRGEA
jgi:hypothetical protein